MSLSQFVSDLRHILDDVVFLQVAQRPPLVEYVWSSNGPQSVGDDGVLYIGGNK